MTVFAKGNRKYHLEDDSSRIPVKCVPRSLLVPLCLEAVNSSNIVPVDVSVTVNKCLSKSYSSYKSLNQ
jgi:hypothetical protein